MTTTSISIGKRTTRTRRAFNNDLPQPRHTLIINLRAGNHPARNFRPSKAFQVFLGRLRTIVGQDCTQSESSDHPRINVIRFEELGCNLGPGKPTWRALDGLEPHHLELHCGWDELCEMAPLDDLATPWPLESIFISNSYDDKLTSKYMHSITTLTLHQCGGISFTRSSQPSALRHLIIIENDAIDMFVEMRRESGIADNIHTLKLESTKGDDFCHAYEPADFINTLQQCTTLLSVDLALIEKEPGEATEPPHNYLIHLPGYFPSNVQHLRFRGPPSLADNMASWLQCAADPAWLPSLKTISFRLDVVGGEGHSDYVPTPAPTETPLVVHQFLDTLSARRPSLSVIQ